MAGKIRAGKIQNRAPFAILIVREKNAETTVAEEIAAPAKTGFIVKTANVWLNVFPNAKGKSAELTVAEARAAPVPPTNSVP